MNILKRELSCGIKPFVFWSLGIFVLVFAGSIKFTGIEAGGENIKMLIDSMPLIVRALMGIIGLDITTFGGYYSLLSNFALILSATYAVYLGSNAVTREAVDKTYEFIFTKPVTRNYILCMKLLSALIFLIAFCVLNFVFSILSVIVLKIEPSLNSQVLLFSVFIFISSFVFFSISVMICSAATNSELGAKTSNYFVMCAFAIGILHDMLENAPVLRFFTPFKFFASPLILTGNIEIIFVIYAVVISVTALVIGFVCFEKRDLIAS